MRASAFGVARAAPLEKPALRIDFNRYVAGQEFLGLKSLALDNLWQDPSMIRERLAMLDVSSYGSAGAARIARSCVRRRQPRVRRGLRHCRSDRQGFLETQPGRERGLPVPITSGRSLTASRIRTRVSTGTRRDSNRRRANRPRHYALFAPIRELVKPSTTQTNRGSRKRSSRISTSGDTSSTSPSRISCRSPTAFSAAWG